MMMFVVMVMTTTVAVLTVFMVMVFMVVASAITVLSMFVMVVLVFMVMTTTVAVLTVFMVMVMVFMVVASAITVLSMLMIVIMVVGRGLVLDTEIHSGILYRMHHHMLQLMGIDIGDGRHEMEVDLLLGHHGVVMQDTLIKVCKIEVDTLITAGQRHLDVAQEHT